MALPAALLAGVGRRARSDPRADAERARARTVLEARGSGSLQPYRLLHQSSAVADECGESAFAFARAGRTAVVLGDPSGESNAAWRTFDQWAADAVERRWRPVVYQASQEARDRLEATGWHGVLVGMEAVIDPSAFRLGSPGVANVRHTVTRSRKGGLSVAWSRRGLHDLVDGAALRNGMAAADEVWRRTAGPSLGFTVGQFDVNRLDDAAIAVARSADGTVAAFVVLRPSGADGGWMLDLIRRLPGSVPGAVEACLVAAIEGLSAEGVQQLSLGLAPLHGLDPNTGPAAQRLLAIGARLVRPLYDYPGLAFFKGKFAPQWLPRYLVVRSRGDFLPSFVALLRLHLGGSWTAVIRSLGGTVTPGISRRTRAGTRDLSLGPEVERTAVHRLREPELATREGHADVGHGQHQDP